MRDALPRPGGRSPLIVTGVGNPWRGDDAAGLAVARRLRGTAEVVEHESDGTGLVEPWRGRRHVVVVDACVSGAAPGTVRRFDANAGPLPVRVLRSSTHAFGVADAVELARALGCLPPRLEVYAIEGADFSVGAGLSPEVAAAVERLSTALSAGTVSRPPAGASG